MDLIPTEIAIHAVLIIGVGSVVFLARRRKSDSSSRTKLFTYYFIVQVVVISTLNRIAFITLASAVVVGGTIEILRLRSRLVPLVVFIPIAAGFLGFSLKVRMSTVRACYLVVAVFDFASEIGGRIFGRTRILPAISPGKTVEGLVMGMLSVFSVAAILSLFGYFSTPRPYLLTAIIAASAFLGDTLASFCKRRNGIKDFSSLIPAHGGILDRFDSFIFSAAVVFVVISATSSA